MPWGRAPILDPLHCLANFRVLTECDLFLCGSFEPQLPVTSAGHRGRRSQDGKTKSAKSPRRKTVGAVKRMGVGTRTHPGLLGLTERWMVC